MILRRITVSFKGEYKNWEEPETFEITYGESDIEKNILSINSPLAQTVLESNSKKTLLLATRKKFKVIEKVFDFELEDYTKDLEGVRKKDKDSLIELSKRIPLLLAASIEVPDKTNDLCEFIVSIKLEHESLSECRRWLEELNAYGLNLFATLNKIDKIIEKQQGIEIKNIRNPYLLNTISTLYYQLNSLNNAKEILLYSLTVDPNNPYTLVQLGKVYRKLGLYQEGGRYYERSLRISQSTHALNGLAAIYRDMSNYSSALDFYQKSLKVDPSKSNTLYVYAGMGAVYFDLELYAEGISCYEKSNVSPRNRLREVHKEAINNKLTDKAKRILEFL